MKISPLLSDEAVMTELGARLAQRRLDMDFTQVELARRAGIARATLERIEAGGSAQASSLIRILRSLDLLPGLDALIPEPGPSPMALLKLQGKQRRRARSRKPSDEAPASWTWGDERP